MNISKELKKIMIDENISQSELAEKLSVTQQNISAKLKKNDYRINELINIANILGYDLEINFVKRKNLF